MTDAEKLKKVQELHRELMLKSYDMIFFRFFDVDSVKMLDKKIEVITSLINGKAPADIPDYYSVLERYPKDGVLWD